ncbi:hypothetical protein Q0V21_08245 [Paenibacillus sp. 11B]|uniref:hypothetical protein n=1 Tax=Paenibacillus sp. 11B TaxID=3060965 RepID=UPI00264B1478|nr:hypothetical protein [Paenibacillus sp. 11B]MDN8588759.1 hypothetical protein [Paenibacillus sp. 11B]
MNLLEAAKVSAKGKIVISNTGREYEPHDLRVTWYGEHYASMRTADMTSDEAKGRWRLKEEPY